MKKFLLLLTIIIVITSISLFLNDNKKTVTDDTLATYRNSTLGISFKYPKILTASATDGTITLFHDIPFENTGECDMTGEDTIYPRLTDFRVTMKKMNKGLVDTMKTVSPYIPQENFINNQVIESSGFIDKFSIGTLNGYAIYEGAEGCGQTTYYFPVKDDQTLIVGKASIQILSGIFSGNREQEVLAVPGAISREQSQQIFLSILQTLSI
ncbi:MAG: hypothetical protein QG579_381 [Patescibacteria group bacterium]|nr:hypothetical protein [Patescibacteria group bacterium]